MHLRWYLLTSWHRVGSTINKFRRRTLNLEVLDILSGPSIVEDLKIPWTYCMSPALVPKPEDWQNNIGNNKPNGAEINESN